MRRPRPPTTGPAFHRPPNLLAEIAAFVRRFDLISEISAGTDLFRVRLAAAGEVAPSTALDLGPPPSQHAIQSNRMSAAGISVLYVSRDRATALKETPRPMPTDQRVLARFAARRAIKIVDLSKIGRPPSLFDSERRGDRDPLLFLSRFAREVSKPIARDDRVHVDYVPTQVVSEYLKVVLRADGVDGIQYRSSLGKGGLNVAVFVGPEAIVPDAVDRVRHVHDLFFTSTHRDAWIELMGAEVVR